MQVSVYELTPDDFLVIVPKEYANSAYNINAIAKAIGRNEPAAWHILDYDFMKGAKTVEI